VLAASLSNGEILGWTHRVTGSSVMARWLPPAFQKGIDIDAIDSAADIPYDIPNLRAEYMRDEPPAVPTGFWRGVGPNNNVFAVESFIDELAKKAGKDPVIFRRDMLGNNPRLRAAIDLAASKAGWGASFRHEADAASPRKSPSQVSSPPSSKWQWMNSAQCV
jgi:isoquinoline 1-oxidoreductase beta subunit